MLARRLLPALLLRPRGATPAGLVGHFHSQAQISPRRTELQCLNISSISSSSNGPSFSGFWRRNYSATAQNDRQTADPSGNGTGNASVNGETDTGSGKTEKQADDSVDVAAQLKETIAKHNEEVKEIRDKYMRALAETENVRQRLTRQISDANQFGIQSFAKDLLEVSDILSKAMETIPKEAFKEKNPHFQNLFEGLRLTEAQMTKVFTKHGLQKMSPVGEKFDPNEHEALFEAPAKGQETGTILTVTQPGFKLHKRVVRPARVGVVRNP